MAKPPDVFRFDATRCYCRIRHAEPEPELEPRAFEITFEIQIKTAFEHAWSVVTHDLVYKTDDISWTKRRLAAQLKAMVEQIDEALVDNFERVAGDVPGTSDPETAAMAKASTILTALRADGLKSTTQSCPQVGRGSARTCWPSPASITRSRGRRASEKLQEIVRGIPRPGTGRNVSASPDRDPFQAVVAQQIAAGADLSRFPLVASTELTDLYGVEVLKPIEL